MDEYSDGLSQRKRRIGYGNANPAIANVQPRDA
jgi:hypothetical protein